MYMYTGKYQPHRSVSQVSYLRNLHLLFKSINSYIYPPWHYKRQNLLHIKKILKKLNLFISQRLINKFYNLYKYLSLAWMLAWREYYLGESRSTQRKLTKCPSIPFHIQPLLIISQFFFNTDCKNLNVLILKTYPFLFQYWHFLEHWKALQAT